MKNLRASKLSIRTAIMGMVVIVVGLLFVLVAGLGSYSIDWSIRREAQARVNHGLNTARAYYDKELQLLASKVGLVSSTLTRDELHLGDRVSKLRKTLNLDILNACDKQGNPLVGASERHASPAPVQADPILRRAMDGEIAFGTVAFNADRVDTEKGRPFAGPLIVKDVSGGGAYQRVMFWWVAAPIRGDDDGVVGVLYGGRALSGNYQLVDNLRDQTFGTDLYEGLPVGTATIFLDDLRVSTNVLGADGDRAVGTHVSSEVRKQVLEDGVRWQNRALVVENWYLSAYEPIRNPDGQAIGMLYVGLLEAPYEARRAQLIGYGLLGIVIIAVLTMVSSIVFVKRITAPLQDISEAASAIAGGEHGFQAPARQTYAEVQALVGAFSDMQQAITERDRDLKDQNRVLQEANDLMKADLAAAAKVQRSLLPNTLPIDLKGAFAWHFNPCDELGGDILNIIRLNAHTVSFYVLDVAGHGVPAALLSVTLSQVLTDKAPSSSLLYEQGEAGTMVAAPPARVAERLNHRFPTMATQNKFVTMAYAILDTRSGVLRYCLAGHPPPVFLRQGEKVELACGANFPIGVVGDEHYAEACVELQPGDRFFFYTDGFVEAKNTSGQMLGIDGLCHLISTAQAATLDQTVADCLGQFDNWRGDVPLADDLSLLAVEAPPRDD